MTDLELRRKTLEVCGWAIVQQLDYATLLDPQNVVKAKIFGSAHDRLNIEYLCQIMPAVESDPGVSEPMFLEFCKAQNLDWQINICHPHDGYADDHVVVWIHSTETEFEAEVEGGTPSEARAKAILAILRKAIARLAAAGKDGGK